MMPRPSFDHTDEDGDALNVHPSAAPEKFPMMVTVTSHEDGSVNECFLDEETLRRLLSWLSDTITT